MRAAAARSSMPSLAAHRGPGAALLVAVAAIAAAGWPAAARASFPGDNGRLVFSAGAMGSHIYSAEADGSDRKTLTNHGGSATSQTPGVSPDGASVVFTQVSGTPANDGLWTMTSDGTGHARLAQLPVDAINPPRPR